MEIIRVEQVSKAFGDTFRLGPLDLNVAPGEILGIAGPEGAGKTTFLKLLWGFIRPDSGHISIFGMQPHLNQLRLRRQVGYLASNTRFDSESTAKQFVQYRGCFYDGYDETNATRLLIRLAIDPKSKMQDLSSSDQTKVQIVSAAAHQPELLLLDQPTSGMDSHARFAVLRFLRRLAKQEQLSIVISCPILDDLDYIADSVLMLKEGQAIEYASLLQQS